MNRVHSRDIQKVWTVLERKISAAHRAGAVLEPGYWVDYDPFF
ncbi:hypothetical protein J2Y03_002310 [Neobacillus niacini]|nr:hypothetical protein [Neobacillus niacini]MDR7077286.1 hypothetical protein [Neobacillus niacini]